MSHVINLFAGPGAGKSTLAADIFAELKSRDVNCELVTEVAKELVWKEDFKQFDNQFYLFGEQYNRMHKLIGKVDVIVTDYPILLFMLYHNSPFKHEFYTLLMRIFHSMNNHNYFVERQKSYSNIGRIHSEHEANVLDQRTLDILESYKLPYTRIPGDVKFTKEFCDKFLAEIE